MRSGVIAQKVGMTRIFTRPASTSVTVLRLREVPGARPPHRGEERLRRAQLGAGTRKPRVTKPERASFAKIEVEPKRKLAEFRVSADNLIEVGAEITADHFVPGQFVDVTGTNQGKGSRAP